MLKECNATGKKSGFKGIEMLQAVVLTADEWTPESGLVTAAQKLQRKKIAQRYDAQILVRFFFFPSRLCRACSVVSSYVRARARGLAYRITTDWHTGGFREREMNSRTDNTRQFSPKSSHLSQTLSSKQHFTVGWSFLYSFSCLGFTISCSFSYTTSLVRGIHNTVPPLPSLSVSLSLHIPGSSGQTG